MQRSRQKLATASAASGGLRGGRPPGLALRRARAKLPNGSEQGEPLAPSRQWKESPQAQEPVALGLSIVKPCFSIVSTKSIVAPDR